ncbi:MAG: hypothetical protein ABJO02_02740 [Reichenbachiella sp.]|uniref:hypothetical protein n=1 Tax=Reichenbachiella sp. TaxID=2184521 RepID=UPI003297E2DA
MSDLDVKHFLDVYRNRMKMQEAGITQPTDEVKKITRDIVEKLSAMPIDELIEIMDNSLVDSKGNVVAALPTTPKD